MANDDQQTAAAGDQEQQDTAPAAQNQAQDSPAGGEGTPTPKEVQQRASEAHNGSAESVDDLPEWAQREIRNLRGESASQRTARQQAETQAQQEADAKLHRVLEALGVERGEDEDPQQAAERDREAREAAEQEARAARVELAVFKAAPGKNADPARLLNTNSFHERVKDLDPTDGDALAAAIEDEVKANPYLAATQAAARSSADFTGGDGADALTPEKFRAMDMAQRNQLYRSDPDTYRRLAATK